VKRKKQTGSINNLPFEVMLRIIPYLKTKDLKSPYATNRYLNTMVSWELFKRGGEGLYLYQYRKLVQWISERDTALPPRLAIENLAEYTRRDDIPRHSRTLAYLKQFLLELQYNDSLESSQETFQRLVINTIGYELELIFVLLVIAKQVGDEAMYHTQNIRLDAYIRTYFGFNYSIDKNATEQALAYLSPVLDAVTAEKAIKIPTAIFSIAGRQTDVLYYTAAAIYHLVPKIDPTQSMEKAFLGVSETLISCIKMVLYDPQDSTDLIAAREFVGILKVLLERKFLGSDAKQVAEKVIDQLAPIVYPESVNWLDRIFILLKTRRFMGVRAAAVKSLNQITQNMIIETPPINLGARFENNHQNIAIISTTAPKLLMVSPDIKKQVSELLEKFTLIPRIDPKSVDNTLSCIFTKYHPMQILKLLKEIHLPLYDRSWIKRRIRNIDSVLEDDGHNEFARKCRTRLACHKKDIDMLNSLGDDQLIVPAKDLLKVKEIKSFDKKSGHRLHCRAAFEAALDIFKKRNPNNQDLFPRNLKNELSPSLKKAKDINTPYFNHLVYITVNDDKYGLKKKGKDFNIFMDIAEIKAALIDVENDEDKTLSYT